MTEMRLSDKVNDFLRASSTKQDLLVLVLLSAILKTILSLCIGVMNPDDGVVYITAAQKLAGGAFKEALAIYGMPLYPLLIALTHYFIPDWIAAALIISIISSVLTIIPLYLLTKEMFYQQAALWACAAFALGRLEFCVIPCSSFFSHGAHTLPIVPYIREN